MRKLNLGSGLEMPPDWENFDREYHGGNVVGDVLEGLPWADGFFDVVVCHHMLHMLDFDEADRCLDEVARVLHRGGWFRMSEPDVHAGLRAWKRGDREWFPIADTVEGTLDGKLCRWMVWHGTRRSLWTPSMISARLYSRGFEVVYVQDAGETRADPVVAELDRRPDESWFLEARLS